MKLLQWFASSYDHLMSSYELFVNLLQRVFSSSDPHLYFLKIGHLLHIVSLLVKLLQRFASFADLQLSKICYLLHHLMSSYELFVNLLQRGFSSSDPHLYF